MSDENALRLDWADFEPTSDRDAMALALLVAGIVIDTDDAGQDLPGDLVRPAFAIADRVIEALASSGRTLATLDAARDRPGRIAALALDPAYAALLRENEQLRAANPAPAGLDVERLERAMRAAHVPGAGRVWAEATATQYARLAEAQQREGAT